MKFNKGDRVKFSKSAFRNFITIKQHSGIIAHQSQWKKEQAGIVSVKWDGRTSIDYYAIDFISKIK